MCPALGQIMACFFVVATFFAEVCKANRTLGFKSKTPFLNVLMTNLGHHCRPFYELSCVYDKIDE